MKFASSVVSLLATTSGTCAFTMGPAVALGRASLALLPMSMSTTTTTTTSAATEEATCTDTDSNSSSDAYEELVSYLQDITHLSRASAVLGYDQMVFMPQTDQASKARGQQSAALAAVIHDKSTSQQLGQLLEQAAKATTSAEQERVLALATKAYQKKINIPTALASQQASLSAEAYNTWAKARADKDYSQFQDIFGDCIQVAKEVAEVVQTPEEKEAKKSLYATMLDEFETGMDPVRMDELFAEIQQALVPLIDKVLGDNATPPDTSYLSGQFDVPAQEALSKQIVRQIGFDDTNGRMDVSVHPFSSGISKHDVRITTRFREDEWYQGLAGSMHEAGHAMYEQNLGDSGLPVDSALSMGMHESQSLFWERHVGLSKPFWQFAAPLVNENLGMDATSAQLYGAVNHASRSLIRVEADELTYPLHVILRYRLEREFVEGRLDVKDIPTEWNKSMQELLNVDVPDDAMGCLQDVHWSMMAYGYFPTYLLGAATAAQWAHYCQQDIPDFDDRVAAGEFDEIKAWMIEKVHQHGSRYTSLDEHLQAQVGEPLNPKYFIDYLTKKYTELYKC
ncbi:Carboxypeptidase [Seminavis robusta]|uniref:Carboxypeptidase n=1 Tax=Seminavis robusta TaxID=568900 RepID=A0A9N8HMW8_9STRA|nr:Carboxypeptidase [Seminavis robusta]|eukprot:Sro937_g222220.1 Carboxypeptidase (567) ;mRNA; r:28081-29781